MKDVYRIGRIGKPHGVKGEMNFMFTDDVFDRTDSDYLIIEVEGLLVPFFIEHYGNIYVVDPRYNSTNKLKSQFADAGLDDILFVNNLQVANSNYWQKAYHRLIGISY